MYDTNTDCLVFQLAREFYGVGRHDVLKLPVYSPDIGGGPLTVHVTIPCGVR